MARRRTPGANESAEQIFRRAPLGCPLTVLGVGAGLTVLFITAAAAVHQTGHHTGFGAIAFAIGPFLMVVGLIVLPFGIRTKLRRMKPVVLTCPACGAESRSSPQAFRVQRWPDVPYAAITCSRCGKDFTVDRYARLV